MFGLLVVAFLVALLRIPSADRDVFWAEDGRTFIGGAARTDPVSWFQPYAGYLHLVPRILASAVVWIVPVGGWAIAMTVLSCAVAAGVAVIVWLCSVRIVSWAPARLALALLTVLTPLASREVLGDAANLHSLLFWGALWAILATPSTRRRELPLAVAVATFALTEIQTLFLVPVALLGLRHHRGRVVALVAAAGVQLIATLAAPRVADTRSPVDAVSIAYGWVLDAAVPDLIPASSRDGVAGGWGAAVVLLAIVPLTAFAFVIAKGTRRQRVTAGVLLYASVVVWCAGVVTSPAPWYDYATLSSSGLEHYWLSRYGVVPGMCLLALMCLAIDVLRRRGRPRVAIAVLAALALLLAVQAPTASTRRTGGPSWSAQIAGARSECSSGVDEVTLRETIGWVVTVPCTYFRESG